MTSWSDVDGRKVRAVTLEWGGGQNLTLTNDEPFEEDEGTQFWFQELDGWYGGVDVHADNTQRTLGHGLFPSASLRTGRVLSLAGLMQYASEQDRNTGLRFVSGILGDGDFGTLTVELEDGPTLYSTVKLDGAIKSTEYGLDMHDFTVPLIAADPFLYSRPVTLQLFPAGSGIGIRYPLFSAAAMDGVAGNVSWGKPNPNVKAVLTNRGNATSHPEFRIVGDWPGGFVLTDDTGRSIEYPVPVTPRAPVTIDCAEGALYQGGYDQSYRCVSRSWFDIGPRAGASYRVSSLQSTNAGWVEVTHRDTYL